MFQKKGTSEKKFQRRRSDVINSNKHRQDKPNAFPKREREKSKKLNQSPSHSLNTIGSAACKGERKKETNLTSKGRKIEALEKEGGRAQKQAFRRYADHL